MNKATRIDYSRTHDLSVEEVRACPEFAHITDEEAKEVIETLKIFAKIMFDSYKKSCQNSI